MAANDINIAADGIIEMGFHDVPQHIMVKLLTDTYTRPLQAAIRETVSNAIDATVRAGKPLGTMRIGIERDEYWNEYVIIADAGDGMEYDELIGSFLSYAASKKRDDDKAIGAFGLGAKAPLAYTDSFDVWTRSASGVTYHAHPMRTENGGAAVKVPEAVNDDARNIIASDTGTLIKFAIKENDSYLAEKTLSACIQVLNCFENAGIDEIDNSDSCYVDIEAGYVIGDVEIEGIGTVKVRVSDLRSFVDAALEVKNMLVTYRIGSWFYPANGSAWVPRNSGIIGFTIDMPTNVLEFVPSRDQIVVNDDVLATVRNAVSERVHEIANDPNEMTSLINDFTKQMSSFGTTALGHMTSSMNKFDIVFNDDGTAILHNDNADFKFIADELLISGFAPGIYLKMSDILATPPVFMSFGTYTKIESGSIIAVDTDPRLALLNAAGCYGSAYINRPNYVNAPERTIKSASDMVTFKGMRNSREIPANIIMPLGVAILISDDIHSYQNILGIRFKDVTRSYVKTLENTYNSNTKLSSSYTMIAAFADDFDEESAVRFMRDFTKGAFDFKIVDAYDSKKESAKSKKSNIMSNDARKVFYRSTVYRRIQAKPNWMSYNQSENNYPRVVENNEINIAHTAAIISDSYFPACDVLNMLADYGKLPEDVDTVAVLKVRYANDKRIAALREQGMRVLWHEDSQKEAMIGHNWMRIAKSNVYVNAAGSIAEARNNAIEEARSSVQEALCKILNQYFFYHRQTTDESLKALAMISYGHIDAEGITFEKYEGKKYSSSIIFEQSPDDDEVIKTYAELKEQADNVRIAWTKSLASLGIQFELKRNGGNVQDLVNENIKRIATVGTFLNVEKALNAIECGIDPADLFD